MTENSPEPGGRYEVLQRLRSSAGVETVLARDTQTEQEVTLKVFRVDPSVAPAVLQEVQSTATTLARVPSEGIANVVDVRSSDGQIALVTHAGRGATLSELMSRSTRYPVGQAAHVGGSIATTLDAAHRVGIVHGALTPESIVQSATGAMTVSDFGFARHPTAIVQSPTWTAYAAPEQLMDGTVDERTDLYALGGLLYLMLTGKPPFAEFDESLLRQHKLEHTPPPPSHEDPMIPPALDALVTRLLARDPDHRPQTAADVAAELARFEEPTLIAPAVLRTETTIMDLTPEPRRGTPWLAIGLAVAVLLLIGGVIAAVLVTRDDGGDTVVVPSVIGQTAATAAARLQAEGLAASTVTAPNDSYAAGLVVAQNPVAGPKVRKGTVVILTVSSGPIPTTTTTGLPSTTTTTSSTSTSTTTTTTTTTLPPPPTT